MVCSAINDIILKSGVDTSGKHHGPRVHDPAHLCGAFADTDVTFRNGFVYRFTKTLYSSRTSLIASNGTVCPTYLQYVS